MPTQPDNEWQEEFEIFIMEWSANNKVWAIDEGEEWNIANHITACNDLKDFISHLLLKQKASLKQRMIDLMENRKRELGDSLSKENLKQSQLSYHARSAVKQKMQIIYDLLSALNEIDV